MAHSPAVLPHEVKQVSVEQLIAAYRVRGHQHANLDPLGMMKREEVPDLEYTYHNLSEADLDTEFLTESLYMKEPRATLSSIIDVLENIYCSSIGYEYMGIINMAERQWIQQYIEPNRGKPDFQQGAAAAYPGAPERGRRPRETPRRQVSGTKRFGLEAARA